MLHFYSNHAHYVDSTVWLYDCMICRVQRRVSFADSLGLDLASIRIMTEGRDTPPYLELNLQNTSLAKESRPQLTALFPQPIANFSTFIRQLTEGCVSLESLDVHDTVITGIIKVKNVAYEKTVLVRYTVDDWVSTKDVSCFYINPLYKPGQSCAHDSFSFQIEIDRSHSSFEFCISYCCAGNTYWDNNRGANYRLVRQVARLWPAEDETNKSTITLCSQRVLAN